LKDALSNNENFSFESKKVDNFSQSLEKFDLVILHQLPSSSQSLNRQIREINRLKIPSLYILGSQTSIQKLNNVQEGLKITSVRANSEEAQGIINKNFKNFAVNQSYIDILEDFPPLFTIFGSYQINNQSDVFLFQKVKNISTPNPLIYFSEKDEQKIGFITGEGLWRWRLYNYKVDENHEIFNDFLSKIVQYLTLNVKKERLIINIEKSYAQNKTIEVAAELYNKNFELVNNPEMKMVIHSSNGLDYEYVFNKTLKSYTIDITGLPSGKYTYRIDVKLGNEVFKKEGEFIVYKNNIELAHTKANHNLLNKLSIKLGGRVFLVEEIDNIKENIAQKGELKPVVSFDKKLNDLINIKALLIVLILFISIEWFIRKYFGGY
jgi:hypothetical protein